MGLDLGTIGTGDWDLDLGLTMTDDENVPEIHVGVKHRVVAEQLYPLLGEAPALRLCPRPLTMTSVS